MFPGSVQSTLACLALFYDCCHFNQNTELATSRHLLPLKEEIGNPGEQRLKTQRGLRPEQQSACCLVQLNTNEKVQAEIMMQNLCPSHPKSPIQIPPLQLMRAAQSNRRNARAM